MVGGKRKTSLLLSDSETHQTRAHAFRFAIIVICTIRRVNNHNNIITAPAAAHAFWGLVVVFLIKTRLGRPDYLA